MPESPISPSAPQSASAAAASPWRLWTWGSLGLVLLSMLMLLSQPDADGARRLIRVTARLSLPLFLLAFIASAWWQRWPSPLSRALMRHRRQVGLLFASSHACHAVAIALMALTSSDAAVRWLGGPRWHALHRICAHLIWLVFVLSCLKRVGAAPVYLLPLALLLAAMCLRHWPTRLAASLRP